MDAEFAAGASKLSALRAKMKALRIKYEACAKRERDNFREKNLIDRLFQ